MFSSSFKSSASGKFFGLHGGEGFLITDRPDAGGWHSPQADFCSLPFEKLLSKRLFELAFVPIRAFGCFVKLFFRPPTPLYILLTALGPGRFR